MPLLIDKSVAHDSRLLLWKVTETLQELNSVKLTDRSQRRFDAMRSVAHQLAFLSVRHLLSIAGYSDSDLLYDDCGKPSLSDGSTISISHSHDLAAIIISTRKVGIDLEWAREKIVRIAKKFARNEMSFLHQDQQDLINQLTVIWGVKESVFKIRNETGISFQDHVKVLPFDIRDKTAVGELHFKSKYKTYEVHFEIVCDFALVFAFEND